jgi:hypothetical protein
MEELSFWKNLESLLTTDDRARWKAATWTIIVGASCGFIDLALGNSVADSIGVMTIVGTLCIVGWVGWYCVRKTTTTVVPTLQWRRDLLRAVFASVALSLPFVIQRLQAKELNEQLRSALKTNNIPEATQVLEVAALSKIKLHATVVDQLRRRLSTIQNSEEPGVWAALLAYGKYGTFGVGEQPRVDTTKHLELAGKRFSWNYRVPVDDPKWRDKIRFSNRLGLAPFFALFEPISERLSIDNPLGPAWLTLTDANLPLDGWRFRNVLIQGCSIVYGGGPVILERIYFERCTFNIVQDESGFQFAKSVLLQLIGPVTYSAQVTA